ncbi:MAG: hypothetical protein CM1200mP2_48140 [Planctomycetaceae bacterium]|nr:MAG: hypothetical protein CM1200mP2_48140 [Planctomycetaceae bacterium]
MGCPRPRPGPNGSGRLDRPNRPPWQDLEIISAGYRNAYDMDFSAEGGFFAYDADMEWDMGSPRYRPTRLCHAVSGSEFGWRSGTGKWPTGTPTACRRLSTSVPAHRAGQLRHRDKNSPGKYQRAVYLCDWTFGTMYAVHLQPRGAS